MSEIITVFGTAFVSTLLLLAVGYFFGRYQANERVEAAENKAEDILSERNYWKDIAQSEIAENIKLGRELAAIVKVAAAPDRQAAARDDGAAGQDDDEHPMSVREADALEMQRRREAERIRRRPKPEDEDLSGREPVHIDDRRSSPPARTTDLSSD